MNVDTVSDNKRQQQEEEGLRCDGCGGLPRINKTSNIPIPLKRCSRCHKAWYHGIECQIKHYKVHKLVCCGGADKKKKSDKKKEEEKFDIQERGNHQGRCCIASRYLKRGDNILLRSSNCLVPPVLYSSQRLHRCAFCLAKLSNDKRPFFTASCNQEDDDIFWRYPVYLCSSKCDQQVSQTSSWMSLEVECIRKWLKQCDDHRVQILSTAILLFRIYNQILIEQQQNDGSTGPHSMSTTRDVFCNLQPGQQNNNDTKEKEHEYRHSRAIVITVKQLLDIQHSAQDVSTVSMNDLHQGIERLKVNAFTIANQVDHDNSSIALAILAGHSGSFINHSCKPNALANFDYGRSGHLPSVKIIVMDKEIVPGQEISLSYIDPSLPRQIRRQQLLDLYGFTCTCVRCTDDTDEDVLVTGLLCRQPEQSGSTCLGVVRSRSSRQYKENDVQWFCEICNYHDFDKAIKIMRRIIKDHRHNDDDNNNDDLDTSVTCQQLEECKQFFDFSSWYYRQCSQAYIRSLLDCLENETNSENDLFSLCHEALVTVQNELRGYSLLGTQSLGDPWWSTMSYCLLLIKCARLRLYLEPDPRRAIGELETVLQMLREGLKYPPHCELIQFVKDTLSQGYQ